MKTVYFCTAINYLNKLNLKDLCNEYNYSPQNMLDTELVHLLSKLNELRLSDKVSNSTTKRNDLKWIGSCTEWVMVAIKNVDFKRNFRTHRKNEFYK